MKRVLFIIAGIVCAAAVADAQRAAAGTETGGYEVIANASGFKIDIPGCADASKNIREIAIDELNIDIRELTTGLDVEYRQYAPGQPEWGEVRLTFPLSPNDPCLADWVAADKAGKGIRKNITVTLFKSDKTPGRSYQLYDASPISFVPTQSGADFPGQGVQVLTLHVGRVGFDGGSSQSPRDVASLNGFIVQALGKNIPPVIDGAWESCTGGAELLELHPASFGANAETKRSHTEVTLRGPMTTGRSWLAALLNEVGRGDARIMLRCGNENGGRGYIFLDGFPVHYTFPRMSVTNTSGNVIEEVRIKPIRVELK